MAYHGMNYRIECLNEKSDRIGWAFIVASFALAFPMLVFYLAQKGIVSLPGYAMVHFVAFYSGAITIGIALAFTLPMILGYARGILVKGKIVGFDVQHYVGSARRRSRLPVVEFEVDGIAIQKTFSFLPVKDKSVGAEVDLLVDKKNPSKAMGTRWPKIVGIITLLSFFFAGLLSIPIFFFWFIPTIVRAKRSVKVTGKIIDIANGLDTYSPRVEYEVSGKKYKSSPNSWSSVRPAVGSPISIKVDSNNPQKIVTKENLAFSILALCVFSLAGVAFACIGFFANKNPSFEVHEFNAPFMGYLIWIGFSSIFFLIGVARIFSTNAKAAKAEKNERLKKYGARIYSVVKEVKVNESVILNGENPMVLVCEGGGRTFTLKTRIPPFEERPKAGSRIIVYVDGSDEKNYFVDLSTLEEPEPLV